LKRYPYYLFIGCVILFISSQVSSVSADEEQGPFDIPEAGIEAQEEMKDIQAGNAVEYAFGKVAGIDAASNTITVSEYDYEKDAYEDFTYQVVSDTLFEPVGSLADINTGNYVDIDYIFSEGKRQARLVMVEALNVDVSAFDKESRETIEDLPVEKEDMSQALEMHPTAQVRQDQPIQD